MLKIDFKSPEIQKKSISTDGLTLVADIPQPVKLFQGQRLKIKTGVALKTDNHAFAVPIPENIVLGLVLGSGIERVGYLDGEIEVILWNRNAQGTPRMIEITPLMPIANLIFMPAVNPELPDIEQEEAENEPNTEKSLEEMSLKDLRAICDKQEIEYLVRATKPDLIALIRGPDEDGAE